MDLLTAATVTISLEAIAWLLLLLAIPRRNRALILTWWHDYRTRRTRGEAGLALLVVVVFVLALVIAVVGFFGNVGTYNLLVVSGVVGVVLVGVTIYLVYVQIGITRDSMEREEKIAAQLGDIASILRRRLPAAQVAPPPSRGRTLAPTDESKDEGGVQSSQPEDLNPKAPTRPLERDSEEAGSQ